MTAKVEGAVLGRPSKYKPEFCDMLIKFFDREPYTVNKQGKIIPCMCPTFEKFCADIRISKQTFHTWCKKHPDFLDAYHAAKNSQANIMMVNGMNGLFNAGFTGLSMKNMHGWADKQEVENTHTVNQMPAVKIGGDELTFDIGEDRKQLEDQGGD